METFLIISYKIIFFVNKNCGGSGSKSCRDPRVESQQSRATCPSFCVSRISQGYLNCLYTNVISLNNKINMLASRLAETGFPEIVCITETWFVKLYAVELAGYKIYRKDRLDKGGGGVVYTYEGIFVLL